MAIFSTPHAARHPDAPFGRLQCETCHGPGKDHARSQRGGGDVGPAVVFGRLAQTPAPEQDAVCLECHLSLGRLGWFGSRHEAQGVPCAACHRIHLARDRVFDALAQQEACFDCHGKRRADTFRSSNHPLRYGSMTCSSCHDPQRNHVACCGKPP
jgi:DmsE family decaheme c-type cytochrome